MVSNHEIQRSDICLNEFFLLVEMFTTSEDEITSLFQKVPQKLNATIIYLFIIMYYIHWFMCIILAAINGISHWKIQ